jgi:hypothetical protein
MYHMRGVFQAKSTAAGAFALRFQDYQARWYDYSRARDAMLKATDTDYASWLIVKSDNKRWGVASIASHRFSGLCPTRKRRGQRSNCQKRSTKYKSDDQASLVGRNFASEIF